MKKILLTLFAAFSIFFTGCGDDVDSTAFATAKPYEEKTFKLTTLENKSIELTTKEYGVDFKDFKDKKVVFLNVFATWCPPCIKEIPYLIALQEKYKDDLQIISVLFKDEKTKEEMIEFKKQNGINYMITYGDENLKVAKEVNDVQKVPEMFMYTKGGVLIKKFIGETKPEVIEDYIQQALLYK